MAGSRHRPDDEMPTGIKDNARRRRIAEAAVDVVARLGVEGLTHRAVAAAAEVPLGSTTYHFDTLEDLLEAAVEVAKERAEEAVGAWVEEVGEDPDLAAALTSFLVEITGPRREWTIVEHELYLAAVRRPALQGLSLAWDRALPDALARFTDPITAEALAMAADGISLQSMIRGSALTRAEVEPLLRRIVE